MILSSRNLAYYLLDRGLVSFDSVVDGDLTIVEATSRNRNFKVIRRAGPSYFVKQVKTWEQAAISSLQREATCYWLAGNDPDYQALQPLIPNYHFYDGMSHTLVVGLIEGGESLGELHRRSGTFPVELAQGLGKALGHYHRRPIREPRDNPRDAIFPRSVPWIMSFHKQGNLMAGAMSAANGQLLSTLKRYPEFEAVLDATRDRWRVDSLIHGDIKWENCVVAVAGPDGARPIKVIDWELADLGDSRWDIGAVFQSYISCWVLSMPIMVEAPSADLISQATFPIESMQPSIRAFWHSYLETIGSEGRPAREMLEVSIAYGAARMIQTAFEYMNQSPQLNAGAIRLLQVSLNILTDPAEAIRELLTL